MRGSRRTGSHVLPTLTRAVALAGAGLAIGVAPATADSGTPNPACPASNPPNTLTLAGGSPQTAALRHGVRREPPGGARQHERLSSDDRRRRGPGHVQRARERRERERSRPAGRTRVTVGTDASGMASAAMFSANGIAGSYTIVAELGLRLGLVRLTNTAAGIPAAMRVVGRASQSATVVDALQASARGQAARREWHGRCRA